MSVPRRVAFRPSSPACFHPSTPTRAALIWWDRGELVLVEPPPTAPADARASTIVAVWPSREILPWHLTEAQVDRLYELHTRWPWTLDDHDVCVHPDGRISPRLETFRSLLGDISMEVGRIADSLACQAA